MPLVLIVFLVAGICVLMRRRSVRKTLRATYALAGTAVTPQTEKELTTIRDQVLTASVPVVNAARLEASARQMIPALAGHGPEDYPIKPVDDFLRELQSHSLLVAGFEQILVGAAASASVTPLEQLGHYLYGAMIPAQSELLERAMGIAKEAAAGPLNSHVVEQAATLVGELTRTAAREISVDVVKDASLEVGKALFDAQALINGLHQVVQYHLPVGQAIADFLSNQTQMFEVGMEVIANVLHLPGVSEAIQNGAIMSLVEHHGMTLQEAVAHHVAQQAQHAPAIADHLQHLGGSLHDGVMSHIPIITIGVVFVMQKRLVDQGKTTPAIAVEQFVVQVGTRWAGAAAGAKGGLLVAHFFGPLAPLIPLVGAAAGAMAGAKAGDAYLRAQLNSAIKVCNDRRDLLVVESGKAAATAISTVSTALVPARQDYLAAIGSRPQIDGALSGATSRALAALTRRTTASIAQAERTVRRAEDLMRHASSPAIQRGFVRLPTDMAETVKRARVHVEEAKAYLPPDRSATFEGLVRLSAGLATVPVSGRRTRAYYRQWNRSLALLQKDIARYQKAISRWSRQCTEAYGQTVARIMPAMSQASASYRAVYDPLYASWSEAKREVDNRLGGLGGKH